MPRLRQNQRQEADRNNGKTEIKLKQWVSSFKTVNNQTLKKHILNFFISEGLYDISKQFAQQSGIQMPDINENQVRARYKIKKYIQEGEIDQGMQEIKKSKIINAKQLIKHQPAQKLEPESLVQAILGYKQEKSPQMQLQAEMCSQRQLRIQFNSDPSQKQDEEQKLKDNKQNSIQNIVEEEELPAELPIESQEEINNNMPEIFKNNKNYRLLFDLKCIKVIKLIKSNKIEQAIIAAKQQLLPFTAIANPSNSKQVQQKQQYMEHIEKVMSLIAFFDSKQSPNYELTKPQYRTKIANELNNILLGDNLQGQALSAMLKLARWSEKRISNYLQIPQFHINNKFVYEFKNRS